MDNFCIHCGSQNIVYNHDHGFYRCNDCSTVWGYSHNDPDYDEFDDNADPDLQDLLLEQMLGSGRMTFI
jgi:transcription initiation factor TFIIIB Brf1 subunit/transcription initiation factor TFIIB